MKFEWSVYPSRASAVTWGLYRDPDGLGLAYFTGGREACELLCRILNGSDLSSQRLGTIARKFREVLNRIET